jgi:hypothetical protein
MTFPTLSHMASSIDALATALRNFVEVIHNAFPSEAVQQLAETLELQAWGEE